jgi:hypothetical protein
MFLSISHNELLSIKGYHAGITTVSLEYCVAINRNVHVVHYRELLALIIGNARVPGAILRSQGSILLFFNCAIVDTTATSGWR